MKLRSREFVTFSVLVFTVGCTGGSEEGRDYAIPDELCGVSIEAERYDSLFPAGEDLFVEDIFLDGSPRGICGAVVDDVTAFSIEVEPIRSGGNLQAALDALRWETLDIDDSAPVEGSSYQSRVWPDYAAAYMGCQSSSVGYAGIAVGFYVGSEESDDYSEALAGVIDSYAEDLMAQNSDEVCTWP